MIYTAWQDFKCK